MFNKKFSKFRLRRWFYGTHRRNPIVGFLAKRYLKNICYYNNEDRNAVYNGELWLQKRLMQYYANNNSVPVVFDVGANTGEWSYSIINMNPNIDLHCFEPSQKTFNELTQMLSNYKNITLNKMGLSNAEQQLSFYKNDGSNVTSLYQQFGAKNKEKIEVNLITGDDYIRSKQLSNVDFLKIDVEGMDYDVLLGLSKILSAGKIQVIQFEYGEFNIQSEKLLKHFYNFLTDYEIGRLHPTFIEFSEWHYTKENFRGANYVAVLKSNKDLMHYIKKT